MKNPIVKATEKGRSIVANLVKVLEDLTDESEMGVNTVQWINDDLDLIEVKYYGNQADGNRQHEFRGENTEMLTDKEAIELLAVRIQNSL